MFPTFAQWRAEAEDDEDPLTYHQVMRAFCQFFSEGHEGFNEQQLKGFGGWVNEAVLKDDDLENAISTCFLEHMRQVKVNRVLAPYLSRTAKQKSHA